MKYRIIENFDETYTIQKSRLGVIWKPATFNKKTNRIGKYETISNAEEDVKSLMRSGTVIKKYDTKKTKGEISIND